jgi:signal transduction histidine kinase
MKLLTRTLKSYLIYSFTLLLVTVPLYYFLVKRVLIHSVDKSLRAQLRAIRSNLNGSISTADLQVWSKLDKDIHLEKGGNYFKDSIYTAYIKTHAHDEDPYRQIMASLEINGQYYKLTISTSMVENEDLLGTIVLVEALLLIGLMTGMLWINSSISKKLWAPFYETLSRIREYEFNKHAAIRLKETNTSEFTDLNRSLENLLNKNYKSYLEQKEFTENASHEMQTPLAIFQSQLEVLMQTSPLTEEQADLINSLEMNNKRMVRLNRSLLLLTKIENEEYQPKESVNITELVKKFLGSYQYYIQEKDLT